MQSDEAILNLLGQYENKYEVLAELHNLSPEDELLALSNLIGFEAIPVDIETFVKDDYYLGQIFGKTLYPIWMERLKIVFPDPIRTAYTFISASGCIGCLFGDTLVDTVDYGVLPIEDLAKKCIKNIKVKCYSTASDSVVDSVAECAQITRYVIEYMIIKCHDTEIKCTTNHPFLTQDGYIEAQNLLLGVDYLVDLDGNYHKINDIELVEHTEPIPVYDLVEVKDYHNYPIVLKDGTRIVSHNSGKSTFATIVLLYDYYKFTLLEDPYKFLNLARNAPFTFRFFNVNLVKAGEVFTTPIANILNESPYFRDLHKQLGGYAHGVRFKAASQARHVLSECMIGGVISEVNFFRPGVAESIIDTMISRMESRMQLGMGILNHVILDSSSTSEDSAMTDFIKHSPYSNELICFNTEIWTAKKHLGIYFNNGSFRVYAGDSETPPFIFNEDHPIDESKLDKDRIIVCPNEVKNSFVSNIQLALQEKCGISLASIDNFIVDKETVKSKFDLPMVTDEIITVDFYDHESIWSLVGENILEVLPMDRRLYCRLDLGVSHDLAGFAISYFDGMKLANDETGKPVSTFKVPVAFDISRVRGQETPINKIRDFVLELSKFREIALITTDQYQSTQLRQEWSQAKLKASMLSVDRSDVPYKTWKMLLMEDRCHVCANARLRKEVLDLKRVGNKIDHTSAGINSKDVSDAACGAVFSCYNQPQEAATPSKLKQAEVLLNLTDTLRVLRKDRQIGKLNNRSFW